MIFKKNQKAIGYEMEGTSAIEACLENKMTEFIIVKGVSDLGDGTKDDDKDERQIKAAQNAVSLCHYVFSNAIFGEEIPEKAEKTTVPAISSTDYDSTKITVVGREDIIKQIDETFQTKNIVSLNADGGMGKTVTAEYYSEKYKDSYNTRNSLQFSENIKTTLTGLYDSWRLPDSDKKTADVKWAEVKAKLRDQHTKYLIVIHINDERVTNLTDADEMLFGDNVKIFITTRANSLPRCVKIEIPKLSRDEMIEVFINNTVESGGDRDRIKKEIDDNPDTFDKITADIYLSNTMLVALSARIKYVEDLSLNDLYEIVKKDPLAHGKDTNIDFTKDTAPASLTLAGHIKNLYNISKLSDEQVDFLRNMSLMDYEGVPLKKFNQWMEFDNNKNTEMSLEKNGFIKVKFSEGNKKIIYMHPAVSDAVFEQTGASAETCEDFLKNLYNMESGLNYLHERRYLIPVAEFICDRIGDEETKVTSRFFFLAGDLHRIFGNYEKALEYYNKNINISEKVFGVDHAETATSYNNIGLLYYDMGDYEKALEYHNKDLIICEKVLGTDHPDTATSYNNIGAVYNDIGEYEKALEYYNKDLKICEKVLGTDHPSTATSYNNIGSVYNRMGEYEKALEYYNKDLSICEKVLGKDHPETAISYYNIGSLYHKINEYEKALDYKKKALLIHEKVFGSKHPLAIIVYHNIATTYEAIGDHEKAAEYYEKAGIDPLTV